MATIGIFDGSVISIPLNIKWEFRFQKNFSGNIKLGAAFNNELQSNYNYPTNKSINYSDAYTTFNTGFGVNYFISKRTAIYTDYEIYILGNDRSRNDWFDIVPDSPNNNLFNIGIKHNFGK